MDRDDADPNDAVEMTILPRSRDIGGFEVSRVLPAIGKRMVGPFIFLDQMGPTALSPQHGLDVRPHPHIGLSTVTYLFEGTILHRDSVGSVQAIEPGAVNWMTAGSGIAHSERTPPELRQQPSRIFGMQSWVALPKDQEEVAPSFIHHGAETLPYFEMDGSQVRVIAGSAFGSTSPVVTASPLFYAEIRMPAGSSLAVPPEYQERAAYLIDGQIDLDGKTFDAARLLVLKHGPALRLTAMTPVHLLLLGGEPMDGPRYIWWNFVSSSQDRIEAAKADWKARRFDRVIGETEFIPLPEG
ncbi:MAG: pirin family protein [Rhodospirillaceae bacterium]|nr:MAG: pirin family protein [Rhodospirillaceae bacterium]